MKRFQSMMKKGPLVFPVVLIILGILFGYLLARIFYSFMPEVILNWNEEFMKGMSNTSISGMALFRYVLLQNIREMVIFFMLCLTILCIPYYAYSIIKKSFQISFLVTTFLYVYGTKGIFLGLCHYFPQMLVYLPAAYLCLKHGYDLYMNVQNGKVKLNLRNNKTLNKYIKYIFIITGLFIIGSAIEAFLGRVIWIWAIKIIQKQ